MDNAPTPSDLIAARIRELREGREGRAMTVAELAARCKAAGMPRLTAQVLYKMEGQRANRTPRPVTVDELLVLAYALDVAPAVLITGTDDDAMVPVTPGLSVSAREARGWMAGFQALPGTDEERYGASLPASLRAGYARDAEEALAAIDAIRKNILLEQRMRGLREQFTQDEGR